MSLPLIETQGEEQFWLALAKEMTDKGSTFMSFASTNVFSPLQI